MKRYFILILVGIFTATSLSSCYISPKTAWTPRKAMYLKLDKTRKEKKLGVIRMW